MKKVLASWMSNQEVARQKADGGPDRIEMDDLGELVVYCRRHNKALCFVPAEAMVGNKSCARRLLVILSGQACPLAVSSNGTFANTGEQATCDGEYLIFDSPAEAYRFLLEEYEPVSEPVSEPECEPVSEPVAMRLEPAVR